MRRMNILKEVEIFDELSAQHLEKLAAVCQELDFDEPGEVIVQENAPSDELYIIVRGTVDILMDPSTLGIEPADSPGPTTIATLQRGQTFGEVGLVDRGLRSASAHVATKGTQLLAISREALLRLCQEDYELGYRLMRNVASDLAFKIRNTDFLVREQLLWRPRPK